MLGLYSQFFKDLQDFPGNDGNENIPIIPLPSAATTALSFFLTLILVDQCRERIGALDPLDSELVKDLLVLGDAYLVLDL